MVVAKMVAAATEEKTRAARVISDLAIHPRWADL
jgi:hypothetical protein